MTACDVRDHHANTCAFCSLITDAERNDTFLCSLDSAVAFVSLNQAYPGWSLVVLKNHYEDVLAIPESEFMDFNRGMRMVAKAIQQAFESPRINYAILGNEVPHVHWHIIPRYPDDPNWGRPPWPIKERRRLSTPGYQQTAQRIRRFLL
ncbi:MAG: HIT family protein [Egibacteraceae bacterium]